MIVRMSDVWKRARRASGLARFERRCRLTRCGGRYIKAWRVPGTQEHGTHCMLTHRCNLMTGGHRWTHTDA